MYIWEVFCQIALAIGFTTFILVSLMGVIYTISVWKSYLELWKARKIWIKFTKQEERFQQYARQNDTDKEEGTSKKD